MASAPQLKLFDLSGNYAGSVKTIDQAAMILANLPFMFSEVRLGHSKKQTLAKVSEGDDICASPDTLASEMYDRYADLQKGA